MTKSIPKSITEYLSEATRDDDILVTAAQRILDDSPILETEIAVREQFLDESNRSGSRRRSEPEFIAEVSKRLASSPLGRVASVICTEFQPEDHERGDGYHKPSELIARILYFWDQSPETRNRLAKRRPIPKYTPIPIHSRVDELTLRLWDYCAYLGAPRMSEPVLHA